MAKISVVATCLLCCFPVVFSGCWFAEKAFENIDKNARFDQAASQMITLQNACESYKLQVGRYPPKLDDLYVHPAGLSARQWRGPYLTDAVPLDPWGKPYKYEPDEANNRVLISSGGPDGKTGTADDISAPID